MTLITPAYRLTLYAPPSVDATEATVLTPVGGAPHSDPFQITTLPALAGYKPYLGQIPTGRTGRIDVLTKRTDVGQMTFRIQDHKLSASSQLIRWLTAYFGDAFGRMRMLHLKGVADESLDGGTTWNASGLPYWTGRVQTLTEVTKNEFDLVINDMSEDLKALAFVGFPHASVQGYAGPLSLLPIGVLVPYGQLSPALPLTAVAASSLYGPGNFGLTFDSGSLDARPDNMVTEELLSGVPIPISWGNFLLFYMAADSKTAPLRIKVKHTSGALVGQTGIYKIGRLVQQQRKNGTYFVTGLACTVLDDTSAPGYLAAPANGVTLQVLGTWRDALIDQTQPLLINDQHPAQHIKDIALGYYGWLYKPTEVRPGGKNIGDPKRGVAIDTAAFTAMIADTSYPTARLWTDKAEAGSDVIEKYLCQGYQIGYYFDGGGKFVPVDLRIPTAAPTLAIGDVDVVASANFQWSTDRGRAVQRVDATYYYDYSPPLSDAAASGNAIPSIAKQVVYPIANLLEILDVGTLDLGDQLMTIDARGYRYMNQEAAGGVDRQQYETRQLEASARHLTYPYGSGGMLATLTLRRTANVAQLKPGTLCLMTVSWLPDPFTLQRGGTRVMRCLSLQYQGLTVVAEFLDYGSGTAAGVPALGTPTQAPFNTTHGAQIQVTSNSQGDDVELQVAVTATSVGSAPPANDPLWKFWGVLHITTTPPWVFSPSDNALPGGVRVWFRARSRPAAYNRLQQPSAWVVSTSVDLVVLPPPTGLVISAIASTTLHLAWTPGSTTLYTDILLSQPNGQPFVLVRTVLPGTTSIDLIGLDPSTTVGIQVRHTDFMMGFSTVISGTAVMLAPGSDAALPALTAFRLVQYR